MTIKNLRSLLVLPILLFGIGSILAQEVPPGLSTGLREYQAGQFEAALAGFKEASADSSGTEYGAYADFWIARSLMALSSYDAASDAFDLFLAESDSHPYREEATYQRARLFYLTEEYEAAVQRFNEFQVTYPESDFSANALYWTGESLFALGLLTESRSFFEEVTEKYPTSYRVEAARYRQNVIDLKEREDELLTLLQWSHEEYLSALDEFRRKELAYQEALQSYRDRLRTLAAEDSPEEIELLNARVAELEASLAERDAQINELLTQLRQAEINPASGSEQPDPVGSVPGEVADTREQGKSPATTAGVQGELLSLKAAALELQQRLLQQGSDQ
ncbi:MAG: tetratricopeptide repeat protein [Spirochaetia bacterium]